MNNYKDIPGYEGLYKIDKEGNIINKKGCFLKSSLCKTAGGFKWEYI